MKILDIYGNELQESSVDYARGYAQNEQIFVKSHEAVDFVPEQGHFEYGAKVDGVFVAGAVYASGGQDAEWIVDVPAVAAQEAWDEYEDILRYIEYTPNELAERAAEREVAEQRQQRQDRLIEDGVLWAELAAALSEGVNSI